MLAVSVNVPVSYAITVAVFPPSYSEINEVSDALQFALTFSDKFI